MLERKVIDHTLRTEMVQVIRRYINGEISAFEFDDRLQEISENTEDQTVRLIASLLWYTYDDIADHKVVADKSTWDYFYRLMLVLESNAVLKEIKTRQWSWRQTIALSCFIIFLLIMWKTGWGGYLVLLAIPFGLISMLLTMWRHRVSSPIVYDPMLFPFNTIPQLARVRRAAPFFRKSRYPVNISGRRIRSTSEEKLMRVQWRLTWLLWGPVVIFIQAFPEITRTYELRTSET